MIAVPFAIAAALLLLFLLATALAIRLSQLYQAERRSHRQTAEVLVVTLDKATDAYHRGAELGLRMQLVDIGAGATLLTQAGTDEGR